MEKIRVMLVDDDRLAVSYMESIVDWEELGFTIVAKAYNGKQALNLVSQCSPHLVITDISMPHMNGLELSKRIKEISRDIHVVLLTAYGEFEYAKEAVQLGIDFYIIKDEVNRECMGEKLSLIKNLIDDHKKVSTILFQKVILDYFQLGEDFVRELYREKALTEFLDKKHNYLLIEENLPVALDDKWEISVEESDFPKLLDQCLKIAASTNQIEVYSMLPQNRILFVLDERYQKEYEEIRKNYYLAQKICSGINENKKHRYTVYVTEHRIRFGELYQILQEEDSICTAKEFTGTGKVYYLRRHCLKDEILTEHFKKEDMENSINEKTFLQKIEQAYTDCCLKKGGVKLLYRYYKMAYQELLLEERKYDMGLSFGSSFGRQMYDLKEVGEYLKQYYEAVLVMKEEKGRKSLRPEVKKAIAYLQEHYRDSGLKVSDIAGFLEISESRISVIFKEDTGKTLIQYLTQIRMEKVKLLLTTTNYKIYEIAEMVGYNNSQYLSNVFCKEVGCFPLEYKRKKSEE